LSVITLAGRRGLVPWHWKKPLKALKLATFNARVEMVATKPMIRDALESSGFWRAGRSRVY
jgi:putative SOS response-associated peptidase YedK